MRKVGDLTVKCSSQSKANIDSYSCFLLHVNADDQGVFALCRDWISQCIKEHSSCTLFRLNSLPGYVPARLIRIEREKKRLRLRLRDRSAFQRRDGEYVALSHCWGSNPELVPRTTVANLESRMEDIPWNDLSKTFQDAMQITVELGKSYIWIDSLCIVQDDLKDVNVHCESMSQIYSNSFCTISATGAKDGTEGCFMPRHNAEMYPCVIEPLIAPEIANGKSNPVPKMHTAGKLDGPDWLYDDNDEDSIDDSDKDRDEDSIDDQSVFTVLPTFREWTHSMKGHLLSRGWTLQERELSVRILHFTSDRLVWECRECYASEDDPSLKAKNMFFDVGLKFRLLDGRIKDRKNRPQDYKFSKWMDLVEEYSTRKLSIKGDKLRAIAGLAEAIKSIQQDDIYLAGLWKRDLITQLLWFGIPNSEDPYRSRSWPPMPVAQGIPSWSWAAYDGAVIFDRPLENGSSSSAALVRNVTSSQFTLSGQSLEISFSEAERNSSESWMNQEYYKWSPDTSFHQIYFTLDADPGDLQDLKLLCLVLVKHRLYSQLQELGESSTNPPTYWQTSSSDGSSRVSRSSLNATTFLPRMGTITHLCNY